MKTAHKMLLFQTDWQLSRPMLNVPTHSVNLSSMYEHLSHFGIFPHFHVENITGDITYVFVFFTVMVYYDIMHYNMQL